MGERRVWQLGAGTSGKTIADVFLRFGVGLIGPGDAGPWDAEKTAALYKDSGIRQFAQDASEGDIFLLRQGRQAIRAIGLVDAGYQYLNQFEDVDGWDLQHARRVRWCFLPEPYVFPATVFGSSPSRFSGVNHQKVIEYANKFIDSPPTEWQHASLPSLPEEESRFTIEGHHLATFVAQVADLVPLFSGQSGFGEVPTEDELIVHLVVPLLVLQGWRPELIAIKWRRVDITLFDRLPRQPENCRFIIEAKRFDTGFEAALKQAREYLGNLGVMRNLLITDGVRYRYYSHEKSFAPVAYANLYRPKQSATELLNLLKY